MIKCPKCGADNMINAIFCRSCGEKIDYSALKIEDQLGLDDEKSKRSKASQRANQIVGAVLAAVIVILLAALMIPVGGSTPEEPSEDAQALLKRLESPSPDKEDTVEISETDLTNLINKKMGLPRDGQDTILPYSIAVVCNEDGTVKIICKNSVFSLPINAVVSGKFAMELNEKGEAKKGTLGFTKTEEGNPDVSISLGWIPCLPDDATVPFIEQFRNTWENALGKARSNIKGAEVSEGKVTFTVAKGAAPKKKKGAKKGGGAAPAAPAAPAELPF